jgi:Tol biopolymer transport system component
MRELSVASAIEGYPAVSADGYSIFFAAGVPVAGQLFTTFHLYVATRKTTLSQFGEPAPAAVSDGDASDTSPFVTADGEELWFASGRDGESFFHIWRAPHIGDGFGAPVPVPELKASAPNVVSLDLAPTLSADRLSIYFASARDGGPSGFNIWTSHRDSVIDGFQAPHFVDELVMPGVASTGYPGWLSPDNCRLYGSNSGLFVATRQP